MANHTANRCTYGDDHNCGAHGREHTVESYNRPGAVTRSVVALSAALGPRGVWMRNAGWRKVKAKAKTRQQTALDACASRKISYDMATVAIRKAR